MRELKKLSLPVFAVFTFAVLSWSPSVAQTGKATGSFPFQGENEARIKENFAIFDLDKDGTISRTEFRLTTGDMFFLRDRNRDMFLTPDEVPNASAKVFGAADLNRDGKLSPYEFGESPLMKFDTYDLNKDGTLTLEEVHFVVKNSQQ